MQNCNGEFLEKDSSSAESAMCLGVLLQRQLIKARLFSMSVLSCFCLCNVSCVSAALFVAVHALCSI